MRDNYFVPIHDTSACWYRNYCDECDTETCNRHCRKMQQTKYMLDLSELPFVYRKHQDLDVEKLNLTASDYICEICKDIPFFVQNGYNAYFYGGTGTGKTSWAVYILTNYFSAIAKNNNDRCRGLFISVPKLLRNIKLNIKFKDYDFKELVDTIPYVDLVIWDDIIQTEPTAYERQWLYSLINDRITERKSNIFTSNMEPEDLNKIDKQLYSRIYTVSDAIDFSNIDLRGGHKFSDFLKQEKLAESNSDVEGSNK